MLLVLDGHDLLVIIEPLNEVLLHLALPLQIEDILIPLLQQIIHDLAVVTRSRKVLIRCLHSSLRSEKLELFKIKYYGKIYNELNIKIMVNF